MRIYHSANGSKIFCIALITVAIVGFTPIITAAIGFPVLTLFALFAILPNLNKYQRNLNSSLAAYICLYLLWGFVFSLLHISDGYGTIILQMQFFFCILLMLLIPSILSPHHRFWILALMLLVVCFNILDNIRLCILYPEIAFAVNRSMDMVELIGIKINIGGSGWYNGVTFFFTVCFFTFLNAERKIYRYMMLGCVILSGLFIFNFCLKASVIVFTVMAAVLIFFAKRYGNNMVYLMVISFVFIIGYVVVDLYTDEIVEFLVYNIKSKRLAFRLIALVDADNEAAEIGTVNGRVRLWMLSLKTWLDNPMYFLMGIGDHSPKYRIDGMGIGYHSAFFDLPARYGLIGLLLMYNILHLGFKRILHFFDKQYYTQLYVIFGLFILFGFTKGVFIPSVGCSLFLLLPLSSFLLGKSNTGNPIRLF